ncbi:PRC-barrel domain-containing protein [Effusibacillus consociatus]|uniref:PRC-barrel domain-containing protein n=1 Tax=Effusibacillus consociatus TaxID=1117041 RepID=A0ABV9Q114_9BACL
MKRSGLWIGLPVIEVLEGTRIGEVVDVLFDPDNHASALLIKKDGLLAGQGIVPLTDLKSVGEDAITIESADVVKEWESKEYTKCLVTGDEALTGKELYTEDGTMLGTVADVYIGTQRDNIVGYEVSDGLLADLVTGRKWIPATDVLQIGNQMIVKANTKLTDLPLNT